MTLEQFAQWCERKQREIRKLDYTETLRQIVELLIQSVSRCFDESHDPDGAPWQPLELAYRRPLVGKHGFMKRYVIASYRAAEIQPRSLTIDVDSEVAAWHNFGLKKRPQRELLGFGQSDEDRAADLVAEKTTELLLT